MNTQRSQSEKVLQLNVKNKFVFRAKNNNSKSAKVIKERQSINYRSLIESVDRFTKNELVQDAKLIKKHEKVIETTAQLIHKQSQFLTKL